MSELEQRVARAVSQFIQPLPYDDLPRHRKMVTPRPDWGQADIDEVAQAAIKAYQDGLAEQGLVVVPREPTALMYTNGRSVCETPATVWRTMLSAAHQQDK